MLAIAVLLNSAQKLRGVFFKAKMFCCIFLYLPGLLVKITLRMQTCNR